MAIMTFRIADADARRFDELAAQHGGRSALLRTLIQSVLEGGEAPDDAPGSGLRGRALAREKVMIRLPPEVIDQVDAEAKAAKMRRTRWIANLIRARFEARPAATRAKLSGEVRTEIQSIEKSLQRIGTNVNQMARAMNRAVLPGTTLDRQVETMAGHAEQIRALGKRLQRALVSNDGYWDADA